MRTGLYLHDSPKLKQRRSNISTWKATGVFAVSVATLIAFLPKFTNFDFSQFTNRYRLNVPQAAEIDVNEFTEVDSDSIEGTLCIERASFGAAGVMSVNAIGGLGACYPEDHRNPFSDNYFGTAWFKLQENGDYVVAGFNPNVAKCEGPSYIFK